MMYTLWQNGQSAHIDGIRCFRLFHAPYLHGGVPRTWYRYWWKLSLLSKDFVLLLDASMRESRLCLCSDCVKACCVRAIWNFHDSNEIFKIHFKRTSSSAELSHSRNMQRFVLILSRYFTEILPTQFGCIARQNPTFNLWFHTNQSKSRQGVFKYHLLYYA